MRALAMVVAFAVAAAPLVATAQPTKQGPRATVAGIAIPRDAQQLEIDDCTPQNVTPDELRRRAAEHFDRGATLYVQGDYRGAVQEFVSSYCSIPFYSILKDIGQAYERALDYERAIGYLARYVEKVPPDAKPMSACEPDPQVDRETVRQRISVLASLRGQLLVQTEPADAKITLARGGRVAGRATSNKPIELEGGTYDMVVASDGHVTQTRKIELKIGKPLTQFVQLEAEVGDLVVQVTPADARVFVDDRFVGIGRIEQKLRGGSYRIMTESSGRLTDQRRVEVLPNRVNRVQVELAPRPQFGRRQLIVFSAIGGGLVSGNLLAAFDDPTIGVLGGLGGVLVGGLGSYLFLPETVPLGTSNLTITASLAGGFAGATAAALFTERNEVVQPVSALTAIAGVGIGYYAGSRTRILPGDAALINSSTIWGTVSGALFATSFNTDNRLGAGLIASGLGLGLTSGVLMARYYDISRTHAALIDVGGVIGIFGGLALVGFVYPDEVDSERNEHFANFALGGMTVGLIAAGVLTRNMDAPKIPVTPNVTRATMPDGSSSTVYGISGAF